MLSGIRILASCALLLASSAVMATAVDCVSINDDVDALLKLQATGQYREPMAADTAEEFSYDVAQPYPQYLAYAARLIAAKNPKAAMPCPIATATTNILAAQGKLPPALTVAQLVAPFELTQADHQKAVLLIHGLTDSPYVFHDLAASFYAQGFSVRTLLLPGHGTAAGSLRKVSYQQWQQAVDYAIKRTQQDFNDVYLGGFSTGGALILNHLATRSMQHDKALERIKGVLLFSPASKAKSDMAWLAKYLNWLPFVNWLDQDGDSDFAKYESFPVNAAAQVDGLMTEMRERLYQHPDSVPDIPLFVALSADDQTIAADETLRLFSYWHHAASRTQPKQDSLLYYGEQSTALQQLATTARLEVLSCARQSAEPHAYCRADLKLAHTAITNAPTNPHYGVHGHYRNCGHYLSEPDKYRQCKIAENIPANEKTAQVLAQGVIKRLTYNPFFNDMLMSIKVFLH